MHDADLLAAKTKLEIDPDVIEQPLSGGDASAPENDVGTDAIVLVHAGTNRIYELNASAAELWRLLSAGLRGAELVTALAETYQVEVSQLESEIRATLQQLEQEGLLRIA